MSEISNKDINESKSEDAIEFNIYDNTTFAERNKIIFDSWFKLQNGTITSEELKVAHYLMTISHNPETCEPLVKQNYVRNKLNKLKALQRKTHRAIKLVYENIKTESSQRVINKTLNRLKLDLPGRKMSN